MVDLQAAMEETSWAVAWYLDLETGRVMSPLIHFPKRSMCGALRKRVHRPHTTRLL